MNNTSSAPDPTATDAAIPETTAAASADPANAAPTIGSLCAEPSVPATIASSTYRRERAQIQTTPIDPRDIRPSWPIAIATLERLSGWGVLALRLGTLALIQQCVRELAAQDARADLVVRLRVLTDALAHMPLET